MILKTFPINSAGRDFVVGDMHGCFDEFQEILKKISFDAEHDRMFSVGDLIDRGKKNMECLRLIEQPWFHAVRGNHENMMINSVLKRREHSLWEGNGGAWSHTENIDGLEELCKLAETLPLAMTVKTSFGKVGICHADPPGDWDSLSEGCSDYMREKLTWGRTKIYDVDATPIENIDYTIHGHTPIRFPATFGNSLFIDTGAVFRETNASNGNEDGGYLSIVELEDVPKICTETQYSAVLEKLKKNGEDCHE